MNGCSHQRGRPCAWPGCSAGVAGARLVVCGPQGARYFERGFAVHDGTVVVAWVEVEVLGPAPSGFEDAMRYAMEATCQG